MDELYIVYTPLPYILYTPIYYTKIPYVLDER